MTDYIVSAGQTLSGVSLGVEPVPPPQFGGSIPECLVVLSGGTASSITLNGGTITVNSGGVLMNAIQNQGAFQEHAPDTDGIADYGTAINTNVNEGEVFIGSGGIEIGGLVSAGGSLSVQGKASGVAIAGTDFVYSGGSDNNDALSGKETVYWSAPLRVDRFRLLF